MEPLVIIGAGGHGRELLDVVEAINAVTPTWRFLGFLDDGEPDLRRVGRRGAVVLGGIAELAGTDARYAIGIGDPATRRAVDRAAAALGRRPATLVHPTATLGGDVRLGAGCVLTAGARLTTNVTLGRHVHLNLDSTVSHDCNLEDYVTLSPGVRLAGTCTVGAEAFFGIGATVLPHRRIGDRAVIGAGAVVVRNVPAGATVLGVPAREQR